MKRRQFIASIAASTGVIPAVALGQQLLEDVSDEVLRLNPYVRAKEKVDKRQYDTSHPEVFLWHSELYRQDYENKPEAIRTVGFVEAVSDERKILYIPGFSLRPDSGINSIKGFYLRFGLTLSYLALPRKIKGSNSIQERYSFSAENSERSMDGIEKDFLKIDYRKLKLIDGKKEFFPDKIISEEFNSSGGLVGKRLGLINGVSSYPGKNIPRSYIDIADVLHFDITHKPIRFRVELPPLIIRGVEVKMPVCFFEPYDVMKMDWL